MLYEKEAAKRSKYINKIIFGNMYHFSMSLFAQIEFKMRNAEKGMVVRPWELLMKKNVFSYKMLGKHSFAQITQEN